MNFMFVIVLLVPFNCTLRIHSVYNLILLLSLAVHLGMKLDLLTLYSTDK
jgi:hypothetical protein